MDHKAEKQKLWREQKQAYRKNRKEYTLTLSLEESTQLEGFATVKNMQVLEFIKSLLKAYQNNTGYILPKDNTLKELVIEIRKIGNNINQITRFINTNKRISESDIKMLQELLSQLEQIIVHTMTNPTKKDL